jgi:hypothetical protein
MGVGVEAGEGSGAIGNAGPLTRPLAPLASTLSHKGRGEERPSSFTASW